MHRLLPLFRAACETQRKLVVAAMLAACLAGSARHAAAQPAHANPAEAADPGPGAPAGHEAPPGHESGLVDVIARVVNFAILAGTLVYLLRSPIAAYLADRSHQIRSDLVNAAESRQAAAAQLEEIDRKMKALPGEIETLRAKGAAEIAAEGARIRAAAAAARDRLLEQARRDIDLRVTIAERALVSYAADLAVGVATERIKDTITDEDQRRLVDRYVQQLKS
jgi:F-type H+-transporting ATPase subunit b